jgi:hypothetical protein
MNDNSTANSSDSKDNHDDNSQETHYQENIKALQRKLTIRDQEYKKALEKINQLDKDDKKNLNQKDDVLSNMSSEITKLREEQVRMREDQSIKEIKKKYPKISDKIIRLLLKSENGKIEDVDQLLNKQSEALGVKKVESPKFTQASAKSEYDKIKKDKTLSMDQKLEAIHKVRSLIK